MKDSPIRIIDYTPQYKADFKRLNVEWISHYFTVEAHDLEQLDHPEQIISDGGYIFIAVTEGVAIGTTALIKNSDEQYELAKMSVTPAMRGRQIGKLLAQEAIQKARSVGAKRIFLETNSQLTPAINLYKSVGFEEIPLIPSEYARADYQMLLEL